MRKTPRPDFISRSVRASDGSVPSPGFSVPFAPPSASVMPQVFTSSTRQPRAGLLEVIEEHQPEGRHARHDRAALLGQQLGQTRRIVGAAGPDELPAEQRPHVRKLPGIAVKHRREAEGRLQHAVLVAGEEVGGSKRERAEHHRSMRVDDALRLARRARGVTDRGRRVLVEIGPIVVAVPLAEQCLIAAQLG